MVKIQSSIGESNFQGSGRKNFVVDDESDSLNNRQDSQKHNQSNVEINPAVAAGLRRQAFEQQQQREYQAVQDARKRIEILTGLGRNTKDVLIKMDNGTVSFTLRTLKSFEQNCLAQVIENANRINLPNGTIGFAPTSMFKIKVEALGHSLFLIDGQDINLVLGTANFDYNEQVQARKELIEEMDGALIDYLFSQYENLSKETYDGYAVKTAEEAKELVEALRKSGTDSRA